MTVLERKNKLDKRYSKINIILFGNILRISERKRIKVLAYIIEHADYTNCLSFTFNDIAADQKINRVTASEAIHDYIIAGFIKRNGRNTMVNPDVVMIDANGSQEELKQKFSNFGLR